MSKSLILENRNLRQKVARLKQEVEALRQQCKENCHESTIEELRAKYDVPRWLLSERSYEVLATKTFPEIEAYMADRARIFSNKPKIVTEEAR